MLSSSLDVDGIVIAKQGKTTGYFYDTTEGGNGAAEAIFNQLSRFAAKAFALAMECDCEGGCPRCLHSPGCPQKNLALHKDWTLDKKVYSLVILANKSARHDKLPQLFS